MVVCAVRVDRLTRRSLRLNGTLAIVAIIVIAALLAWLSVQNPRSFDATKSGRNSLSQTSVAVLKQLGEKVRHSHRSIDVAILRLANTVARKVGGGRCACCKSGKDRTGMAVTLEQARAAYRVVLGGSPLEVLMDETWRLRSGGV